MVKARSFRVNVSCVIV